MDQFAVYSAGWLALEGVSAAICTSDLHPGLRSVSQKDRLKVSTTAVSFIHGWVCIILSIYSAAQTGQLEPTLGLPNTPFHTFIFTLSLAYFVVDMTIELCMGLTGLDMVFHHAASLLGLAYGVVVQRCGAELVLAMLSLEITNPCYQIRGLLRLLNLKDIPLYGLNEVFFFATFTFVRVLAAPRLTFNVLLSPEVDLFVKASAFALQGLSLLWFVKMMQIAYRRYQAAAKGETAPEDDVE